MTGLLGGAKESLEIGSREWVIDWNRRWDISDVQLWWLVDFAASHKTENTGVVVTLGEGNILNFRINDLEVPWGCKNSSSQLNQLSGLWLWVNDLILRTSTSSHLRKGDWQVVFKEKIICPRNSNSFHQYLLSLPMRKGTNFCSQNWQMLLSEPRFCFCWSTQALENVHPVALAHGLQMLLCDVLSTQFRYQSERLQCASPRSGDIPVVLRNKGDQERILKFVKNFWNNRSFMFISPISYFQRFTTSFHPYILCLFSVKMMTCNFFILVKAICFGPKDHFPPMSGQKGDRTTRPQLLQGSCEVNSLALLTTCAPGTKVILVWRVQFLLWTVN